jgi:tyrosyl-tRNA synthetase
MQGYDSVALNADVELGGTDQTFNLMMGRFLQEHHNQEPQVIITLPLLEGLDGVQKMSKSLGNYIGLWEPADIAYGKIMSIPDTLMYRYYNLLLNKTEEEISLMQKDIAQEKKHPMTLKKELAFAIVKKFWSEQESLEGQKKFEALFQKQDYSQAQEININKNTKNPIWIIDLLKLLGAISGSSEGKRLIEGRAVEIDGETIKEFKQEISWHDGAVIKVGKYKFYKLNSK